MKKLLALFVLSQALMFQSAASAKPTCVPTMTVPEAQNRYDAGLTSISVQLNQDYQMAAQELSQANAQALTDHQARSQEIETRYAQEVKQIKTDLLPNWREALHAATARHNLDLQTSAETYKATTDANGRTYEQKIQQARTRYNESAKRLADEYNQAVCAQ